MVDGELPLLTRRQAPEFLEREVGIPIKFSTFEKLCILGKGPPVAKRWGNRPLYARSAVKSWALARLQPAAEVA